MMPSPRPLLLPLLLTFSMLACKPVDVDETGYLQPPEIDTTSEEEPEEEQETSILVVGNPSAVLVSGGVLTVRASSGDQTSVEVRDPAGSFVARVQAARGDLLELSYELDGRDVIELDLEGTAILPEPDCLSCAGNLFTTPDADGFSQVDLTMLTDSNPPYTLLNETKGIAVRASDVGTARIPAATGDRACLFRDDASQDATSVSTCQAIP